MNQLKTKPVGCIKSVEAVQLSDKQVPLNRISALKTIDGIQGTNDAKTVIYLVFCQQHEKRSPPFVISTTKAWLPPPPILPLNPFLQHIAFLVSLIYNLGIPVDNVIGKSPFCLCRTTTGVTCKGLGDRIAIRDRFGDLLIAALVSAGFPTVL